MEDETANRELLKRLLIDRFTSLERRIAALEAALENMRGDGK